MSEEYVNVDPLDMAAEALVAAQAKAEMLNDVESLMKIAGGWMELHECATGQGEHQHKKVPLGFAGSTPDEPEEEDEELDDAVADPQDFSGGRIYAQHGKFRVTKSRYLRRG